MQRWHAWTEKTILIYGDGRLGLLFAGNGTNTQKHNVMRALKTLVLALAAGLLLTGCTKQYITQGLEMTYLDYDVRSSQWQYQEDGYYEEDGYYRVTLDVPDITPQVVKYGNVQVSRYYPQNATWTPLPAMRVESYLDGDTEFFYTTFTDYEWSERTVDIFVTTSDLYAGVRPDDMSFRVYITQ